MAARIVRARSAAEIRQSSRLAHPSIESREVRAERRAVVTDHQGQIELAAALLREREADETPAVARHEVDRLGRRELGADQQIAFVLAVLLVDEHDHAAGTKVVDDLSDPG